MARNPGADWEILIDGKPRSYRDNFEIARETARYLKSRNPKNEIAIKNYATGEILSISDEHEPVAWANLARTRR